MNNWKKNRNYKKLENANGTVTFIIVVDGVDIEVSQAVYTAYAKSERQLEYMERDLKRDRVMQDANGRIVCDNDGLPVLLLEREVSLERLMDEDWSFPAEGSEPEKIVLRHMEYDELHRCLELLCPDEWALINALFFKGMTEREYAVKTAIPQKTINDRKTKILKRLKKLLAE